MNVTYRVLVALLALSSVSAAAQQKSFADIAREEEQRRQGIKEPSKVYTNDDLSPAGRPSIGSGLASSCASETKDDPESGNRYVSEHCADGTTRIQGSNARINATWSQMIYPDGSQAGIDKCGNRWTYSSRTTEYRNENGQIRKGDVDFRAQLESPAPCDAGSKRATASATAGTTAQPFCGPESSRSDGSGNRVVIQTCLDSVRESGTTSMGTTWQNTILPDGSQYGSNSCGVQWKYDGRTTRYETSLGERGLGERIFRANVERINRCKSVSSLIDTYK